MIDESSAASPHVDCRKPFGEVHHVVRRSDPQLAGSSEDASLIGRGSMNIEHVERMRKEELLAHAMQLETVLQAHNAGGTYQPRVLKACASTILQSFSDSDHVHP